jgi:CheY-like chemotaxis protein
MQRLNILVVEDQAVLALSMGDLLESLGYRAVGPAATLAEAFALLDSKQIDGALLDRNLAGDSSTPLADALDARGIPYAWATGQKMPADSGAPMLRKPFSVPELKQTLEAMFANRPTD